MIAFLDYLFFRVFWWNESVVKEKGMPILSTIIGVALFPYLNLLSVFYAISLYINEDIKILPKWSIVALGIFTAALIYYWLAVKRDYKEILRKNKAYSKEEKTRKDVGIISYILLTFALLIWIVIRGRDLYK